jgi:C4-dicarboxylate-specific signal transduction histidine kinase
MKSITPVASLTQTARELVDGSSLPADVAADLALALEAIGRRADSLVRFVGIYRQLASVPEPLAQPVDVAAMLARLEALVAPQWRARGGEALFSAEPASICLQADAGQLEQALVNLLKNAFEATSALAHPQVTVSARLTRGARLRIEVRDNGPGVPDELVHQLFTPFFSTKGQGGGIGLAMVRHLVHRNGGSVRFARTIGAGARFVLTF